MPITKQNIKRMKQDKKRTARNRHYSSHMKSMIKLIMNYIRKSDLPKTNNILPKVVSSIDIAAKKKLIHKNNAARKKAGINRAIVGMSKISNKDVEKPSKKADKEVEKKTDKVDKKEEETEKTEG